MYESFHIANLFYDMNETPKHAKDPVFYIISTSWFNRWKKYVNFDYFMSNTEKYLKLNYLPSRPESSLNENYLNNIDEQIKNELQKYFDNFFINDNSDNYPGVVSNKELIYDKMTHYVNFDKPDSSLNYNMIDNLENGNDYFIVTRDIWKYFKAVYGGKEIKRYRVSSSANPSNEILIESKLKTLSLILIKPKTEDSSSTNTSETQYHNSNGFPYSIEKPKYVFVSRKASLYDFKKQVIEMFSFLKHVKEKDVRFWVIEPKYTYETLVDYVNEKYNRKTNPRVILPALSLDLLSSRVRFEDLEDIISNKLIVMEYIEPNKTHFPFKSQHLNDFSKEFQDDILDISRGKKHNPNIFSLYDHLIFNANENSSNTLFYIKNFFKTKYSLERLPRLQNDELNSILLRICDTMNENDKINFNEEISCLRDNMDLIFDKSDLLLKLGFAYSTNFEVNKKTNLLSSQNEKKETKLRQDLILKKRERAKILEHLNAHKKETKQPDIIPKQFQNDEIDLTEEKEEEKCTYCGKVIEEDEYVICSKCNKAKYCNSFCLNKDLRFHIKNCTNIIKDNKASVGENN